jgi:hypothetical protein
MSDALAGAALFRGTDTLNRLEFEIGQKRTDMSTLKAALMSADFPEPLCD